MSRTRSRSASVPEDEELRLPRPPGVIRQFWARHPVFADVLIALGCLLLTLVSATTMSTGTGTGSGSGSDVSVRIVPAIWAPLLVVVACGLLLRRRQWPIIVFIASLVVAVMYLFVPVAVGGPLLLVTTYGVAVYRSTRACWTALGIGIGALALIAITLATGGVVPLPVALNAIVGEGVLGLIGALIGINIGNRKRYLAAVIARSRQLLVERDQQGQLAAAAERARIAREMHDIVSHSLTVVVALSEGAVATDDPDRARGAMEAAAHTARDALAEMRTMLGVLRTDEPDVPLAPLAPVDPRDAVVSAQRAGFPVSLAVAGSADAPVAVRYALGRIVQEGVTNAMRHAPSATEIRVRVEYAADRVAVEVANDGATVARGSGFGLRGLAERVAHVGGTVRSGPVGRGRWLLAAVLPYEAAEDPA